MPSTLAPTHYERSKGIMPSEMDPFFTWFYGEGRFEEDCGDVESPLGWVALCHVKEVDRIDYEADSYTHDLERWNEPGLLIPGWYIIRTDNNGFVWAMCYGDEGTYAEETARDDFAEAQRVDRDWQEADDDDV